MHSIQHRDNENQWMTNHTGFTAEISTTSDQVDVVKVFFTVLTIISVSFAGLMLWANLTLDFVNRYA